MQLPEMTLCFGTFWEGIISLQEPEIWKVGVVNCLPNLSVSGSCHYGRHTGTLE